MPLLLYLLILSGALVTGSTNPTCDNITAEDRIFHFPQSSSRTLWFRRKPDTELNAKFVMGSQDSMKYTMLVNSRSKKNTPVKFKLVKGNGTEEILEERVSKKWIESYGWVRLNMDGTSFSLTFHHYDQTYLIQLTVQQLEEFSQITVSGDLEATTDCSLPMDSTTGVTTTTPQPTTSPTTPQPTTITKDEPTEDFVLTTKTLSENVTQSGTVIVDVMEPDVTTDNSKSWEVQEKVEARDDSECEKFPWWVWVCGGVMAAFIIFFFLLLFYTVVLCRRNTELMANVAKQSQYLRGRVASPGGYGVEAKDMEYYQMRNQSLMIGNTTPRIATPIPPNDPRASHYHTEPRVSGYRRSWSQPAPPSIQFPAPPPETPSPHPPLRKDLHPRHSTSQAKYDEIQPLTDMKIYSPTEDALTDDECIESCTVNYKE